MFERRQSVNASSPELGTPTKSQYNAAESAYSPTISRYGRSHKPKMQDDYVSTDKKVSAYLKLSPGNQMQYFSSQKEPKKRASPKKVTPEGTPRRGRPPKTPTKIKSEGEDVMKMAVKAEPQDPNSPVDGCEWMVGDLAWGRVGGHPFWPCMVALDPVQKIFTKTIRKGRTIVSQRWVHVQFFGDNGRRSWLNTTAIMSYNGRDAFVQLGDTILAGMRKKEPKQTSAFIIKPAVIQVWEKAVQEAEDLFNSSREERIAFFALHFPSPLPQFTRNELIEKVLDESQSPPKKRGRKRKAEQSPPEEETKKKLIKLEEEASTSEPVNSLLSSTPRTIADRKKRQALLMQLARSNQPAPNTAPASPTTTVTTPAPATATPKPETEQPAPAVKPAPVKRPSVSEPVQSEKKKPKRKYTKKKLAPDFQAFSSKHFNRVSDDHPELNDKEVNKYLQKMWSEMDETQKARYRSRFTGQEKEESESAGETSEELVEGSSEDAEEEVRSSKSSSPAPLAVATQKATTTKRNICKYLFSGAKSEKVCQICERTGETVKCRGPCQGYYHPGCITNPPPLTTPQVAPAKKGGKRGRPKKSLENSPSVTSSSSEEQEENTAVLLKEEEPKSLMEVDAQDKIDQNGFVEKSESEESVSLVEVTEPEAKGSAKVRKGSKDSESGEEGEGFRCKDCQEGRSQPCFVCHEYVEKKTGDVKLHRCIIAYCGKVYHEECLKQWPQSSWRSNGNGKGCERGVVTCPQHTCHTCASDNPGVIKARYSNDKLVRCIRCPTTYHYGNYCLPAGSEILTNTQIICPQHYQPPKKGLIHHVNAAWCFICASGGSLICCDLCPTAFHADCLNISTPPDGSYVCEDCLTGRFPLYGEIVWVKLGTYRWWPAEILYPALIPDNILNLPHTLGEFAVRFFGSHDHYWVNRGRAFLYQDGDTAGKGNYKKSSVDQMFERAVREASEAQRKYLEEKATRDAETRPGMKPPNYVKLKANKPVGNVRTMEMNVSSLTPCECDPKSEAPCAPESDCLNRILMVECNPLVCPAGDKCCNQLFEKRQYPPLQPYHTQGRGWGLKTLVALKKGDFVIEYVGEMIDEEEYKKRLTHMHENNEENFYFLTIDKDRMLDAGPKGNVARFMNHSCQPNCETQKWTVNGDTRVGLFALCDIPANTELVFNYNLESIGSDKKPCMCGAPNCSGFIGVKVNKNQDKEESKEKKPLKKKKTTVVSKAHEEDCFVCGEGGELLLCDGKHCTKGYHLGCLGKKQRPQGYWLCPWHQCNVCNKGRVRRCTFCVNSFCQEHSEGNIRLDDVKGLVCTKHDQENTVSSTENDAETKGPSSTEVEPTPMEVDSDSKIPTTISSESLVKSSDKVEPINNNVLKAEVTPRPRLRRSRSYTGGKPGSDVVANGNLERVSNRRGRPSSVDDKLIVSFEKTDNKDKEISTLGERSTLEERSDLEERSALEERSVLEEKSALAETSSIEETSALEEGSTLGEKTTDSEGVTDVLNLLNEVISNLPVEKADEFKNNNKGLQTENVKTDVIECPSLEEDNQSTDVAVYNEGVNDLVNQSLEINKSNNIENNQTVEENLERNILEENQINAITAREDDHKNNKLEIENENFESEKNRESNVSSPKKVDSCDVQNCFESSDDGNENIQDIDSKIENETLNKINSLKTEEVINQNGEIQNCTESENDDNDRIGEEIKQANGDVEESSKIQLLNSTVNIAEDSISDTKIKDINENKDNLADKTELLILSDTDKTCDENVDGKTVEAKNHDSSSNEIGEKIDQTVNSAKSLDVDEHVDDFELSYSECSNDKLYKSANSESSIEMKLTDCAPTEDEVLARKLDEISSQKRELANCIEQTNVMEVA